MSTSRFFESKESADQQPPLILVIGPMSSGKTALISNALNSEIKSEHFSLHEWKHDNKTAILVDCPSLESPTAATDKYEKRLEEIDNFLLKQKNKKISAVVCTYRIDTVYFEPAYERAHQVAQKLEVPFILVATHCTPYTVKNPARTEADIKRISPISISATVLMNNISQSDLRKQEVENLNSLSQALITSQEKFNLALATKALFGKAAKCLPDDEYILRDKPQLNKPQQSSAI